MSDNDTLKDIAYDAFVYTYPLMEQAKTINGMFEFIRLCPNKPVMNSQPL